MAPIQGYTDFIFRKVYHKHFNKIDKYFIPYISVKGNGEIRKSQILEILPENNSSIPAIPQILVSDSKEAVRLSEILVDYGYKEINLNIGCPYPMATKKGRGAGMLPYPDIIYSTIDTLLKRFDIELSVKTRTGLLDYMEFERVLPVLNEFPLKEVIIHPRTAKMMYKEKANLEIFNLYAKKLQSTTIYNGDILSLEDIPNTEPHISGIMIGRGLLRDPFIGKEKCYKKLRIFHDELLEENIDFFKNNGNVLVKMKAFWEYFCYSFQDPSKTHKKIKKTKSFNSYISEITSIFQNSLLNKL